MNEFVHFFSRNIYIVNQQILLFIKVVRVYLLFSVLLFSFPVFSTMIYKFIYRTSVLRQGGCHSINHLMEDTTSLIARNIYLCFVILVDVHMEFMIQFYIHDGFLICTMGVIFQVNLLIYKGFLCTDPPQPLGNGLSIAYDFILFDDMLVEFCLWINYLYKEHFLIIIFMNHLALRYVVSLCITFDVVVETEIINQSGNT
ncbi:hypothetical protein ACJX0J_035135, partial [Zea mays]